MKLLSLPKSLGRLEEFAARMVSISQKERPSCAEKTVYVFAADHGVTAEGVSAYPRDVTRQMVLNFLAGGAAINVLARRAGAEVVVVDVGVDAEFDSHLGLIDKKVRRGTRNMALGPPEGESFSELKARAINELECLAKRAETGCSLVVTQSAPAVR